MEDQQYPTCDQYYDELLHMLRRVGNYMNVKFATLFRGLKANSLVKEPNTWTLRFENTLQQDAIEQLQFICRMTMIHTKSTNKIDVFVSCDRMIISSRSPPNVQLAM